MKCASAVIIDGKYYGPGEEHADLGSLVCVDNDHEIREYKGLTQDKDKLPTGNLEKYRDLRTGSTFLATDSDLYLEYEATTKMWYEK